MEQRIAMLMGQMIRGERTYGGAFGEFRQEGVGGASNNPSGVHGVEGGESSIHVLMKQQQEKLRQEYEGKLADLEKERESIGEGWYS